MIAVLANSAAADPQVRVGARMYMRETGMVDDDLLRGTTKASVNNLDYGVLAGEMLIDVAVPDGVGERLTVTVKQGKLNAKQSWKLQLGQVYGVTRGHYPLLVTPIECGGPMTITAKVGKVTEQRTIDFTCSE